ncbi:unnamed protein product, partial [marine sediment metagenome]
DFQRGSKLPSIQDLSEKLQVGRSSVREALKQLQIVGVVELKQGKGTFVREKFDVTSLSESIGYLLTLHKPDIVHLMSARKIIERGTVELATEKASKDEIEKLYNLLQGMKKEIDNPDRFAKYNVQFHITIAKASKNPLLPIFFNSIYDLFFREQQAVARLLKLAPQSIEQHIRIWNAMKERDPDKAIKEMMEHLNCVERAILKGF